MRWGPADRPVLTIGTTPSNFDIPTIEPDVRLEITARSQMNWLVGLGAAFELPFDLDPGQRVWLKLSVNYFEERTDLETKIIQAVDSITDPETNRNIAITETVTEVTPMVIRSIGPGFALEALLYDAGPFRVGFGTDFLMSIPLSGTDAALTMESPGFLPPPSGGPVDFTYSGDHIQYRVSATIRLSWTGK